MSKREVLIGGHISVAGGFASAVEAAESIDCTAIQIFTKSNRSWFGGKITEKERDEFQEALKNSNIKVVCAHTSYLINLASSNKSTAKKSTVALLKEMQRCEFLGIPFLIFHPGSHTGQGEDAGIEQIAKSLDYVVSHGTGDTKILLETTAGQGTSIGHRFEHLKEIMKLSGHSRKLGVCLDTCHVHVAGYDLGSSKKYEAMIDEFDRVVGINKIKVVHLNDTKFEVGSKRDRHENLCKGVIPVAVFRHLVKDERLAGAAKILETPKVGGLGTYAYEIDLVT